MFAERSAEQMTNSRSMFFACGRVPFPYPIPNPLLTFSPLSSHGPYRANGSGS